MRPDGSEGGQLLSSTESMHPNQPRYTPDGERINFTGVTASAREIWMIPSAGGSALSLITAGVHTHAHGSPAPEADLVRALSAD